MLSVRLATDADRAPVEELVLESFEPITWQRKLDERFGLLRGKDWKDRWRTRLERIFATQIVLVGDKGVFSKSLAGFGLPVEQVQL